MMMYMCIAFLASAVATAPTPSCALTQFVCGGHPQKAVEYCSSQTTEQSICGIDNMCRTPASTGFLCETENATAFCGKFITGSTCLGGVCKCVGIKHNSTYSRMTKEETTAHNAAVVTKDE